MHSFATCLVLLSTCILLTTGQRTCPKIETGEMLLGNEWNNWDQDCNRNDLEAVCSNALVTKATQQNAISSGYFGWTQDSSLYTISACYAYVVKANTTLKIRKNFGGQSI